MKYKSLLKLLFLALTMCEFAFTVMASSGFSTRALWASPSSFATVQAADDLIARCQKAGFNLILANVMCYQSIAFKSSHFPGHISATENFDPLANLTAKAHAVGIKVQAWCCVYYEGAGRNNRPFHAEWVDRSITGEPFEKNFISPSNPEVNPYLLSVLKDLLAYEIDGIHLDYIRYPCTAFDYSEPARKAFKSEKGFDPQDFLDHPEKIVPPAEEKFPVRVLYPKIYAEQVWETTYIERTLDQGGVGFAFVTESVDNIKNLPIPGLLMIASYNDVPAEMVDALTDYVKRGGRLLWTDLPSKPLAKSPALQKLTGVSSARWLGQKRIALHPAGKHPLATGLTTKSFRDDSVFSPKLNGARVISKLDTGEPAVLLNESGKGRVVTLGFHLMKSTSPVAATLAKELVDWFKSEAGSKADDALAVKRAEWVAWRGDRVTQLVRDLSAAAKKKDSKLVISSSGGPSPFEFYGCYRDARRWLAEGINDEVFPMNYTPDLEILTELLELQTASAPPGCFAHINPGLQIYKRNPEKGAAGNVPMTGAEVAEQLRVVQKQGYQGFCLFASDYLTDDVIEAVSHFKE